MDHKHRSIFKVEAKKLLWFLVGSFFVALLFQCFDLPYGNVLALLFSANRAPFSRNNVVLGIGESPTDSLGVFDNGTFPSDGDQSSVPSIEEESIDKYVLEHNGSDFSNGTLSKGDMEFNISSEEDDFSSENISVEHKIIMAEDEIPDDALGPNDTFNSDYSSGKEGSLVPSEHIDSSTNGASSPVLDLAHFCLHQNESSSMMVDGDALTPPASPVALKDENSGNPPDMFLPEERSGTGATHRKERPQKSLFTQEVFTISEMNHLLDESHSMYRSMRPRWSSAAEQELVTAKQMILNAPATVDDPALYAPLYQNVSMFKRSYELMEEMLKVYIYKEGDKPIFHVPVLKGIYASEGWFMKQMKASKHFITKDSRKAHLFYLPFSSRMLEESLYVPGSHNRKNLIQFLKSYLDLIGEKYPFWNRTGGADHFLVACHDWAPSETRRIMARCIRALCNSDVNEGFVFGKDASLPETFIRNPQRPLRELGGKPPSKRSILAFFAGNMHGYLRPILLQHWGNNRDSDMRIFGHLPKVKGTMNYAQHMKSSKYCICAKGYEVNSPRVVEAIFFECVPVIISDNFVPPFFQVLNWESFAVFVLEKDIPNLKNILLSIPKKRYREMQMMVKKVQQHFLWHPRPVKYDIFHMILHSVWHNRVLHVNPR